MTVPGGVYSPPGQSRSNLPSAESKGQLIKNWSTDTTVVRTALNFGALFLANAETASGVGSENVSVSSLGLLGVTRFSCSRT